MPGVTFTRKSGKRIADAVHKIEEMPQGQQERQRRRFGGLGRSTLWEVTAVQTGPETVTVRRVSNIAFDLNEPSEKIDILYDPDKLAIVGDRGLLIRLGNGNLFFFRRDNIIRVPITQVARVKDTTPDAHDADWSAPNNAGSITKVVDPGTPANEEETRFAVKFSQQLPVAASLPTSGTIRITNSTLIQIRNWGESSPFVGPVTVRLHMQPILDDFDPTTLTWNQLAGLTKGTQESVMAASGTDITFPTATRTTSLSGGGGITGSTFVQAGGKANWAEAYGLEILTFVSPVQIPAQLTDYTLTWGILQIGPQSYIEWPGG